MKSAWIKDLTQRKSQWKILKKNDLTLFVKNVFGMAIMVVNIFKAGSITVNFSQLNILNTS